MRLGIFNSILILSLFTSCSSELVISEPDSFGRTVSIHLARTFFNNDLDRTPVNLIQLEEGSSIILLKSFNNSFSTPIEFGGYFYGGFEQNNRFSTEQLDWIGNHLKVLSTNEYFRSTERNLNGGLEPGDVQYLRSINSELRYYLMFFATSLHRPYFLDSVMIDWTLKDLGGRPAISVRRRSHEDNIFTMDMRSKDWQNWFRSFTTRECERYDADGFITDEIMWSSYWHISLDSLRDYSSYDEIRFAAYNWKDQIGKDHKYEFLHQAFWDAAQVNSAGVWGEKAFRASDGLEERDIFYKKANLIEVIENAYKISGKGKTYIWASWINDDLDEVTYMIGAYLLAKNGEYIVLQPHLLNDEAYGGDNILGYSIKNMQRFYETYEPYINLPLGLPLEKYQEEIIEGEVVLKREFENGIVYLYPHQ